MSEQNQDVTHLRQRLAQSNIIVDATRRFTSTLDAAEIQQALFESAFQVVGAQQIALHLNNGNGLDSLICYPMEGLRTETAVLPQEATAFHICADGKQVIWHHDDDNQTSPPTSVKAIDQFSSYLALPLKGAEKIVGVIEAFNLLEPHNFEQQAALLTDIAGPAGMAIYNSMLYQEAQNEIAERSRIESSLKKSEEMSKTLLEAIMLPLLVSRISDGTVIYANDRVAALVGLQGDQVVGKQTPNFYKNPEDRLLVLEAIQKHGGVDNMQLPIRRIDGEIIWVVLSNRIIIYDGEEAILTTLVDISARKAAEDALALRADELETVSRVSASAATILEKEKLLQEVVDLTKERLDVYHAHIYLLDANSEELILTAGAGEIGQQMVAERHVIPLNKEQSLVAQVARTKQGLIENDVRSNASFLPHPLLPETRAEMAVPMLVGNRMIGVLDVQANKADCFTEHDISVKSTLAAQISVALENARSFEEAQSALAETEFLLTITQETSGSFNLHQTLTRVLDKILDAVGMDAGLFSVIDSGIDSLELLANYLPDALLQSFQEKGLDNTLCDLVFRKGEIITLPNLEENAPLDVSGLMEFGFKSYQGVPLTAGGTVFGTLCMFGNDYLSPETINERLLSVIGQKIGTAVQTVQLFEQSQRQAQELQIVADLSVQTTLIQQPQSFLEAIVQETQQRFNLYHCHVFIVDESGENLQIRACGWEPGSPHEGTHGTSVIPLSAEKSLVAQAARTRKPVVVNNVHEDPYWLPNEMLPNTRSEMAVPMIAGGQLIGVLDIQSDKRNRFSEQDEQIQLTLAAQTAVALQNARHLAQAEKHAEELALVNRIVTQMNVTQDIKANMQFLVAELGKATGAGSAVINFVSADRTEQEVVAAYLQEGMPNPVGTVMPIDGDPLMAQLLASRQTLAIEDVAKAPFPTEIRELILNSGFRSLYVLPMFIGQELIGSATLSVLQGEQPLTSEQLELAETIAYQAASAIQTARQYDEIQRSQESLRKSESDLSGALETAKLAYWEFNVENDLFTFNDQFYALFHTTAEAHGGYQLSSAYYAEHFVHPEDLPVVGAEIERALNSTDRHYTKSLEHRILYADGGVGYISVNINLERDEQGKIVRYDGANQDITERKRAEEALRKSEANLSGALEVAKLAYWEFDVANDLFTFNDQFYALFHTTAEAHGGYQLSSAYYAEHFVHPEDLPVVGAEIERALNSTDRHYTKSLEHRILYADGGVGYISVNINLERDEQGNIVRYDGANQDITERKKAEEALKSSQADLARSQRIAALGSWELGLQTQRLTLSPEHLSLMGLEEEHPEGLSLDLTEYATQYIVPEDIPLIQDRLGYAIEQQDNPEYADEFEYRLKTGDGRVRNLRVLTRWRIPGEIFGITQDITERKKAEEALKSSQADLVRSQRIAALGSWELGLQTQRLTLSPEHLSFMGMEEEHPEGLSLDLAEYATQYIVPEDVPLIQDRLGYAIEQQDNSDYADEFEYRLKTVGGDIRNLRVLTRWHVPGEIFGITQDITERKRVEEAFAKQAQELQIVAELSTTVATTLEQGKLLQEVVDLTKERFDFYHAQIYLLNAQQDKLLLAFGAGDVGHKLVAQKHQISLSAPQSLVAQAARSGQAVVVNAVRENLDWLPNKLLPETQAEMAVPMMVGDRVVGVLDVQSERVNRFTDQDIQIQTTLAAQVSIALENARSFEQAQTAVSEMNALTQRLTKEGWREYLAESHANKLGFVYDSVELQPLSSLVDIEAVVGQPAEAVNGRQLDHSINVQGASIGHLSIIPDENEFEVDGEITEIIDAVAERLSGHLENLRLTEQAQTALFQTEQQAERLSMLNEMGAELSRADMLEEILEIGVKHTARILSADHVTLGMLTPEREHIEFVAVWGDADKEQIGVVVPIEMADSMKTAVQENQVIVEKRPAFETADITESLMTAPVLGDNRIIGAINIGSSQTRVFSNQDQSLILQISSLLGAAIERQRLAELTKEALNETQRRSEELSLINRVMSAVTGSLDLQENMNVIARELVQALSVAHVGIALMTDDQQYLRVVTEYPEPEPGSSEDSIGQLLPVEGYPLTKQALETRRFAVAYDAQHNALTEPIHDLLRQRGVHTLAVLPMIIGEEIYGTVGFDLLDPDRIITDQQMRLAETIVYHTTTVVQNARLFAQTQQRLADLTVIQQAVSELTVAQSTQEALQTLTPMMMSAVDAGSMAIYEIQEEALMRIVQHPELPPELMAKTQILPFEKFVISKEILRKGEPLILSVDMPDARPKALELLETAQAASSAVVPLTSQQGVTAIMIVNKLEDGQRFSQHDVGLLQTLANQASIALERIRLLEETRQRAQREQLLREIAAKVRSSTQVDSVMRTAVQEIGRTLGRKVFLSINSNDEGKQ